MDNRVIIAEMLERALSAQKVIETYDQERIDELCMIIGKTVYDNAEVLARMAIDETGMGVYEDKVKKNMGKSRIIWNDIKGGKSRGIIGKDEEEGLVFVAKPIGVIGCITPVTNPIVTPMCNAMFAVKGANSVIICPHPKAKKCSFETVKMIRENLAAAGAPVDLVQCIEEPTIELSNLTMQMCDECICTGGAGMVKAAYSSGRPALGVGPGNVQCLIDEDVDLEEVIPMLMEGRCFDNGIICTGEQAAIFPASKLEEAVKVYEANGAYYIDETDAEGADEAAAIRNVMFPGGVMDASLAGKSAAYVAGKAGIELPEGIRMILIRPKNYGPADDLSKEKMAPVQTLYTYDTWDEAISIADANFSTGGAGHTVAVHSNTTENIEAAALALPASRFTINQVSSTNSGGSFFNGLAPTTTLACGSWGCNSLSENVSWRHLFNVSRIAYKKTAAVQPSDDDNWSL
ncbi:MAG: aldehyde dehydrogenase family protein [Firmicutes bacterium]|nr:aldehyde dehydrogenase family protein [Bacillota bacterium]